jgi:mono/diheme cytochrome c family protein
MFQRSPVDKSQSDGGTVNWKRGMLRFLKVFLILCAVSLSGTAFAWNDEGHQIVALIADHYLSAATKQAVQSMLTADPDTLTAHDIASAATWADKYEKSDKDTTRERYARTHGWHFADIDAMRPNIPAACFGHPPLPQGTPASQGPARACIIDKILQFSKELSDPKTDAAERLIALKFLLNLVGDIHQPLRVADENNAHGTAIHVSAANITPGDLFSYWDDAFVTTLGVEPKAIAERLISRISDEDMLLWSSGAPQLWALEAHQIGVDQAYGSVGAPGPGGTSVISDKDAARAVDTIARQLSRAGIRLAFVLNQALAPAKATPPAVVSKGDPKKGRVFAMAKCAVCHVVAPDQSSPREFTTAPDFLSIAKTSGISAVALHEFLFGPHPTMPALALTQDQADDVSAFILSLRKGAGSPQGSQ